MVSRHILVSRSLYLKVAYSQKTFHFGSNLKKKCQTTPPEQLLFMWIVLFRGVFGTFFGDLNQSEKFSEIKLPVLAYYWFMENIIQNETFGKIHSCVPSYFCVNLHSENVYKILLVSHFAS